MGSKHLLLAGISSSLLLLVVATLYYPGGSQYDKNAIGFGWQTNYLSNLFGPTAINGAENTAQPWAIAGMFLLCASFAFFFFDFSRKIPAKGAATVIKYSGVSAMLFAFFIVTPYHNLMVTISSTLALISIFYSTVYVFKSTLHFLKVLCLICLLSLYSCIYMYYTRSFLEFLPIMQKVTLLTTVIWVLGLQYLSKREDFQPTSVANTTTGSATTNR